MVENGVDGGGRQNNEQMTDLLNYAGVSSAYSTTISPMPNLSGWS
jgi:hypothetical protein